jgi:hypothetical protein
MEIVPPENLYSLWDIGNSPATIHIRSGITFPNLTEASDTGGGLSQGSALSPMSFVVCPRDSFRNLRDDEDEVFLGSEIFTSEATFVSDMSVFADETTGEPLFFDGQGIERIVVPFTYMPDIYCFEGTYTPERAGYYELDVTYQTWHDDPKQPILGSPFMVYVGTTTTFRPYSRVYETSFDYIDLVEFKDPKFVGAGIEFNVTIEARDLSHNRKLEGNELFEAYMFQIGNYTGSTAVYDASSVEPLTASPAIAVARITDLQNGSYCQILFVYFIGPYHITRANMCTYICTDACVYL